VFAVEGQRGRLRSGNNGLVPGGQTMTEGLNGFTDFARDDVGFWLECGNVSIVDSISFRQNAAGIFANSQPTSARHGLPVSALSPAEIETFKATSQWFLQYQYASWTSVKAPMDIRGDFVYGSHSPCTCAGSTTPHTNHRRSTLKLSATR